MALVLDGADALGPQEHEALTRWLAAPNVRVLVASRVRTGLPGEAVLEVPPLAPSDALALYEAHAAALGVRLRGPEHRARIAARLAEHDHLPLAVELLAGAADGALPPAGEAGLTAALDLSWTRLSPAERDALAQCTVFAAPFAAEAAAEVLDSPGALVALRRASLLGASPDVDGTVRYTLLRTVRAHAAAQGDAAALARAAERHTAWAAAAARAELQVALAVGARPARPEPSAELLAALARQPSPALRADCVVGLRSWWLEHDVAALRQAVDALADAPLDADRRAALAVPGVMARAEPLGADEAAPLQRLAVAVSDLRLGDGLRFVVARDLLASGEIALGEAIGQRLARPPSTPRQQAHGWLLLAVVARARADWPGVVRCAERAVALLRAHGSSEELAAALCARCLALRVDGRLADAEAVAREALRHAGDGRTATEAHTHLGLVAVAALAPEAARASFALARDVAARRGDVEVYATVGDALALLELGERRVLEERLAELDAAPAVPPDHRLRADEIRALAAADAGEPEGVAALEDVLARAEAFGALHVAEVALSLGWARLALGDPVGAREVLAAGRARLGPGMGSVAEQLLASEAVAAARCGEPDRAEALLARASPRPGELVAALRHLGAHAAARARGHRARPPTALLALLPRSVAVRLLLAGDR
ncbi:MAG: hypothetical protein R3F59_16255 [Myxococcota bacterium]